MSNNRWEARFHPNFRSTVVSLGLRETCPSRLSHCFLLLPALLGPSLPHWPALVPPVGLLFFTHRVLENRQNILQFISLPFIILNLFRDTIPSCSCSTCGFRAFLSARLRLCQVFSVLLEHLWSVFNLVFETVPFLSLSDFDHPSCGVLLSVLSTPRAWCALVFSAASFFCVDVGADVFSFVHLFFGLSSSFFGLQLELPSIFIPLHFDNGVPVILGQPKIFRISYIFIQRSRHRSLHVRCVFANLIRDDMTSCFIFSFM